MRPRATWITVSISFAVVLAVMAWVTLTLLELDTDRTQTQRQGVVEEQARLALWRIDTAMAPILSQEIMALDEPRRAELSAPPPGVLMRFELTHEGPRPLSQAEPEQIAQLEASMTGSAADELFALFEAPTPITRGLTPDSNDASREAPVAQGYGQIGKQGADEADKIPYALKTQSVRNDEEWSKRRATVEGNMIAYSAMNRANFADGGFAGSGSGQALDEGSGGLEAQGSPGPRGGRLEPEPTTVIQPLWIGEELLLIRRAGSPENDRLEGSWLDWPALHERLVTEVADLLPDARLLPVLDLSTATTEHLLATLPARLAPGTTIAPAPAWSPLRASLLAAWLIVLVAFMALFLLVRASLRLSERRATFVSAVTHELRTPLTTFRMYTEMLSEGMVEQKRDRYIATLRREADRLSGLVENVLAYAHIESDRAVGKGEIMSVGLLVDRVVDRLRERCEAADMSLELTASDSDREVELMVDPTAVEQILFNLVDNASKYASAGLGDEQEDSRICLEIELRARAVALHVRDHGPGIDAADIRRIFEPFTKAKADAAGTQPGVGLGLALSRRLARQMGGDLSVTSEGQGADFVLRLPRA